MLNNHWKIPEGIIKKINFNDSIREIKGNKIFFKKEFIPSWYKGEFKRFPDRLLNKYNKNLLEIDPFIEDLLYERYFVHKKPFFTKFPVSYRFVPVGLRNFIFSLITKHKKDANFPDWPIDSSVDLLRNVYMQLIKKVNNKKIPYINFWPDKKQFSICLTHDLETYTAFKNIGKIREVEKEYGFVSSWNILCRKYKIDFGKLKQLKKEKCEIALHGYNHDGRLPFLSKKEIDRRIKKCFLTLKDFQLTSFRSPQLQRNEGFLKYISKYFICDSSIPDTDIKAAFAIRSGCCTVFPFIINKMVEIPLTIPQDFRLIYSLKLTDAQYYNLWKDKIDHIKTLKGIINILTHPDDYISGNDRYLSIYEKILKYLSKLKDYYHATPSDIARWWLERNKLEIKKNKIVGSRRATISYF